MRNIIFILFFAVLTVKSQNAPVELPQEVKAALQIKDDGKAWEAIPYEEGDAVIKGRFLGYRPEMKHTVQMFVNNPVTNSQSSYSLAVADDGSFEGKVPMIHAMQVLFRTPFYNNYILISPNQETSIYIDLQQLECQNSGRCPEEQYMFFAGANADINNQINRSEVLNFMESYRDYDRLMQDISGMTAMQYKTYQMDKLNEKISELPKFNLTRRAQEYLKMVLQYNNISDLMFARYNLEHAYQRAHNNDMKGYIIPDFDETYYSFLKDSPINDPISLYSQEFGNMINSCRYIERAIIDYEVISENVIRNIEETEELTEEDKIAVAFFRSERYENWTESRIDSAMAFVRNTLENIIATNKLTEEYLKQAQELISLTKTKGNTLESFLITSSRFMMELLNNGVFASEDFEAMSDISLFPMADPILSEKSLAFRKKYANKISLLEREESRKKRKEYMIELIGADKGIFFDLMETQELTRKFEDYEPLSNDELNMLSGLSNPFYKQYLTKKNSELIAQIEENKSKGSYKVYDISENTSGDDIMQEIIKPFEGKVIMIDFWATWCGPCRSAMKQFETTKKTFEGKDVVFLYVTNESSPINTWSNMIPNMGGAHVRLNKDQFDYLNQKYGIRGIPAYLILDKKGEQAYFRVGFEGSEALANILNNELTK